MAKILVIEDQPQLLRNFATILEMEGYQVETAADGEAGLAAARASAPDLILSDVMMPGHDGFSLLRELRGEPALASVPFVFVTARAERSDQRAGMGLGADDYLTKPVGREELLETVRARLDRVAAIKATAGGEGKGGFHPDFSSPDPLVNKLGLTPREGEVLLWVAQGKSNGDIAIILGMAEKTVKKHMSHIFEKLGLEGRNAATVRALEALSE